MTTSTDWITTPITAALLQGVQELEPTERGVLLHRLATWAREQAADPQLALAESQPAGVRLVFRTRATTIELDAIRTRITYLGVPERPDGVADLRIDGQLAGQDPSSGGDVITIDAATGTTERHEGPTGTFRFHGLPDHEKDVELWLPFNEVTELVTLRTNAPVQPAGADNRPTWLHYGSSISQGSNAGHPTGAWPMLAASIGGLNLVNLGFSGGAMLDPFIARFLRDTPADLISVAIGINLVNADLMRLRAFRPAVQGFLDTIRDGHPATPLVVVSPTYCPIHEDTPGPGAFDLVALARGEVRFTATGYPAESAAGKLTLTVVREVLADVVHQRSTSDPNLHYVNGLDLYGPADFAELPLPDGLHPNGAAHQRIGVRFAGRLSEWPASS